MIIETILVILGVLTTALGIWNIIIGAYIWGTLFLLGGIWAIGLGTLYIIQIRKERKAQSKEVPAKSNEKAEKKTETFHTEELFEEAPKVIIAGTTAEPEPEEKPKKKSTFRKKEKEETNEETVDAINIIQLDDELEKNKAESATGEQEIIITPPPSTEADEVESVEETHYLTVITETNELVEYKENTNQLVIFETETKVDLDETDKTE